MARKTAGVEALVEEVLPTITPPFSEDVIEEVFVAIEGNTIWTKTYRELEIDLGKNVLNQWIGKYTKKIAGYKTVNQVGTTQTSLTTSYSKLSPQEKRTMGR